MKNELGTEVRALTSRMSHIDEQIGLIYQFLAPLSASSVPNLAVESKVSLSPMSSMPAVPPSSITSLTSSGSPDSNPTSGTIPGIFEAPSFYSDLNSKMNLFDTSQPSPSHMDLHDHPRHSRTHEQISLVTSVQQASGYDATTLVIPPPSSVYDRSASSSIISLGLNTTPRGSVSNKIAPAPPPPVSPKHPLNTSRQPISNTRFNPGRSPKPKSRSQHGRGHGKHAEQSTIIDLESPTQQTTPARTTTSLLPTPNRPSSMTKSNSSVFRRFLTSGTNPERTTISSSSTLLYPPTSDDERPISPTSSGNDDDDYRPLTSSTSKHHHHHTPLWSKANQESTAVLSSSSLLMTSFHMSELTRFNRSIVIN